LAISTTTIAFAIYDDFIPKKHKVIIITKRGFITANNIKSFFENNFIKPKILFIKINIIININLRFYFSNSRCLPKLLLKPKTQSLAKIYKLDNN
jgi:hypothetical protein